MIKKNIRSIAWILSLLALLVSIIVNDVQQTMASQINLHAVVQQNYAPTAPDSIIALVYFHSSNDGRILEDSIVWALSDSVRYGVYDSIWTADSIGLYTIDYYGYIGSNILIGFDQFRTTLDEVKDSTNAVLDTIQDGADGQDVDAVASVDSAEIARAVWDNDVVAEALRSIKYNDSIMAYIDSLLMWENYKLGVRSITAYANDSDNILMLHGLDTVGGLTFYHVGDTAGYPPDSTKFFPVDSLR